MNAILICSFDMRKIILILFVMLTYASIKAQEYINADTVQLSVSQISNETIVSTSSLPFWQDDKIEHYKLNYINNYGVKAVAISIGNSDSQFFKQLLSIANCIESDYEQVLKAGLDNSYARVKKYDMTITMAEPYVLSPWLQPFSKYCTFRRVWNDDTECFDVWIVIGDNYFVDKYNYKKRLKERNLLKDDILFIDIKYGKDTIRLPLLQISSSKVISRCKKTIKHLKKNQDGTM
jgi:hypothetical protein